MLTTKLPSHLNWRYLSETRRFLSLTILVGVVSVSLLAFAVIPQAQALMALVTTSRQEQTKANNLENKLEDLDTMTSRPVAGQMEKVEAVLPSRKPLLELLTTVNAQSNAAQVTVANIQLSPGNISTDSAVAAPTSATAKGKKKAIVRQDRETLSVDLVVQGDLTQLNRFFELLESSAPLTTITDIALSPQSRGASTQSTGLFEAELTVLTYYFSKSVQSSIEASLPTLSTQQQAAMSEIEQYSISDLPSQLEIRGGGLDDLFSVEEPVTQEADSI